MHRSRKGDILYMAPGLVLEWKYSAVQDFVSESLVCMTMLRAEACLGMLGMMPAVIFCFATSVYMKKSR